MKTLLFDTETDGLISNSARRIDKQPRIIELFALVLDENGEEIEVWQSLFWHPLNLSEEIVRITGIDDAMLKDAPKFFERANAIKTLFEGADRVVGHNLTFDRDMVNNEMHRAHLQIHWPAEMICTVEATEFLKGYRLSLTALHEELFGENFTGAHRAETDVRAMARCYKEMLIRGLV